LVVRGDVDGGYVAPFTDAREFFHFESFPVGSNRDQGRSCEPKGLPCRRIAGPLDTDDTAVARERPGREVECLLTSARDEQLSRHGDDTAIFSQMAREDVEETGLPVRALVVESARGDTQGGAIGARQGSERQKTQVDDAPKKGETIAW
jgi:hypothetical protein